MAEDWPWPPVSNPTEYPILSAPPYDELVDSFQWGELRHVHFVIRDNNIPALHEFIRMRPQLLTWEDPGDLLCPPMVCAAELGRTDVLTTLLDYRDTLSPEQLVPPQYDDPCDMGQWGSPLTTACSAGRLDTVQLLLARLPETAVNEYDQCGYTPLLAVMRNRGGPDSVQIIQLLFSLGAVPSAIKRTGMIYLEEHEGRDDEDGEEPDYRYMPGGLGTVLALAVAREESNAAVIEALVAGGVDVHEGRREPVARLDGYSGRKDGRRGYSVRRDLVYMGPLAIAALYHNVTGVATLLRLGTAASDLTAAADDPAVFSGRAMLPLHAAVVGRPYMSFAPGSGSVDTVALLTADRSVCAATINACYDKRGHTPLHLAARFDRLPVLRALLDRGADPRIPTPEMPDVPGGVLLALFATIPYLGRDHYWPSSACIDADADESIDMLALFRDLLAGTDPDTVLNRPVDPAGNTALHVAASHNLCRVEAALLALGARPGVLNQAGQLPTRSPPAVIPRDANRTY